MVCFDTNATMQCTHWTEMHSFQSRWITGKTPRHDISQYKLYWLDFSCHIKVVFSIAQLRKFFLLAKIFLHFYLLLSVAFFVLAFACQLNDMPQYLLVQLQHQYQIRLISQLLSKLSLEYH